MSLMMIKMIPLLLLVPMLKFLMLLLLFLLLFLVLSLLLLSPLSLLVAFAVPGPSIPPACPCSAAPATPPEKEELPVKRIKPDPECRFYPEDHKRVCTSQHPQFLGTVQKRCRVWLTNGVSSPLLWLHEILLHRYHSELRLSLIHI